jgi:hypothetical protein
MRRPVFTVDLTEKVGRSLIITGKWTVASQSWGENLRQSELHLTLYRFHMVGILYAGL